MTTIQHSIEVSAPVRTVYRHWTDFESFPQFMEGIESVTRYNGNLLHWKANLRGRRKEWEAEIVEETPERAVAWRSTRGLKNHQGRVQFRKLSDHRTQIDVAMVYEPEGMMERMADSMGLIGQQVRSDLERFKNLVEQDSENERPT